MAGKKPYDPSLDKEIFCQDFPDEKMRVRGFSYNGYAPKVQLTPIYLDRNGTVRVETILEANGRYTEKRITRLTIPQLNKLYHFIQEKIQRGEI